MVYDTYEVQDIKSQLLVNWIDAEDIQDREELVPRYTIQKKNVFFLQSLHICMFVEASKYSFNSLQGFVKENQKPFVFQKRSLLNYYHLLCVQAKVLIFIYSFNFTQDEQCKFFFHGIPSRINKNHKQEKKRSSVVQQMPFLLSIFYNYQSSDDRYIS